ncbi:MAG: hypothetical protein HOP28_10660 [Gemmatimonadales bacterium]|nr:hypothetical protein [Gemmatimonadales bacterium]
MDAQDRDLLLAICLLAAQADGERSEAEGAQFDRLVGQLGGGGASAAVERARGGELGAAEAMAALSSDELRQDAREMAAAVIYADGVASERERVFLAGLRTGAGLASEGTAEALALAPLAGPLPDPGAAPAQPHTSRPSQAGIPAVSHDAAMDEMIRRQALLTGALELLPQNLASLAIIPLQMRLVYRIGADYGQALDAAQIKDLLGAMGIGAAAQVFDGMARRILGKLAGAAAGTGVAFVTTYALGHAAKQYYEQGRQLSQADLRALVARFRGEAEALLPRVRDEIKAQSERVDLQRVLAAIRGG